MIPQHGWTLFIQRKRTDQRAGLELGRTVGTYQVYRDGIAVNGLSGTAVEREGPGDNGLVGVEEHRCIEAGTYELVAHVTGNYATRDYETDGSRPRPAIGLSPTAQRTAILMHPGTGFASSIGCINLGSELANASSDLALSDSTRRVIAVLDDLKTFAGGHISSSGVADARLIIADAAIEHMGSLGLRLGSRGPLVKMWQAFLGPAAGPADGKFGVSTLAATKAFQQSCNLAADGHAGPRTLAAARQRGFGTIAPMPVGVGGPFAGPVAAVAATPPQTVFGFASEWKHLFTGLTSKPAPDVAESVLARRTIDALSARHPNRSLLIGLDINIFNPPGKGEDAAEKAEGKVEFEKLAKSWRNAGHATSIYLEGAFGATGDAWEEGEAARFIQAAIEAQLCTKANAPKLTSDGDGNVQFTAALKKLVKAWDEQAKFWPHTLKQLQDYKALGYVAAEIDNLSRPFDEQNIKLFDRPHVDLMGFLGFLRTYADEFAKGSIPRLILKNIDEDTLRAIASKLSLTDKPETLPRDMFADFHIFEVDDSLGSDEKDDLVTAIRGASARLGIQAVFSVDTRRYRASGAFGDAAQNGLTALLSGGAPVGAMAGTSTLSVLSQQQEELAELRAIVMELSTIVRTVAARATPAMLPLDARLDGRVGAAGAALTPGQTLVCERILNAFETGSARGDYADISIFPDGPDDRRQITYGRSQTTEYGNLRELVQMYVDNGGRFADQLRPYLAQIGRTSSPLVDDDTFKNLLVRAGREDPMMATTQDAFFEKRYFKPALKWASDNGFTKALSILVIYDSFIQSGSMRQDIRQMFSERPPAAGGDEKTWVRQYVTARDSWLRNHHRPAVRTSAYRTRDLGRIVTAENWDLASLPIKANGVDIDDRPFEGPVGGAFAANTYSQDAVWGDDYAPAYSAPMALQRVSGAGPGPSRSDMARQILGSNKILHATGHVSGKVDDATAMKNISDTADGRPAKRSSYGNAPGGSVELDRHLLAGMLALASKFAFSVSELAGGSHSPNSRHYAGIGLDANTIDGQRVHAGHPGLDAFMAMCRDLGATEVLGPGAPHHDTHVHAAWPRP